VSFHADDRKAKLIAKYGAGHDADLHKKWRADNPTFKHSTAKVFYQTALTAMAVAWTAALHEADLAALYWKNVVL
jgi:hypothetical protein